MAKFLESKGITESRALNSSSGQFFSGGLPMNPLSLK